MEFSDRLNVFFKATGIKKNDLPEKIGVSRAIMFNYLAGKNEPPAAFFKAIKDAFPWVNIEWLITGIGEMGSPKTDEPGDIYPHRAQLPGRRDTRRDTRSLETRLEILTNIFRSLTDEDRQALERMASALEKTSAEAKKIMKTLSGG